MRLVEADEYRAIVELDSDRVAVHQVVHFVESKLGGRVDCQRMEKTVDVQLGKFRFTFYRRSK